MAENFLFFGDNLDVLGRYIKDESVDLIYLDPPFNSNASYNVLFAEHDGTRAASQIKAFHDTWHWDEAAARAYDEFVVSAPHGASQALQAFRSLLGCNDMLAYLSMMAPRLVELHRVLKPTGSMYLHCDPTASHYLKVLLDAIFGAVGFCNEIIWRRTGAHSTSRRWGRLHDVILFYSKDKNIHTFIQFKINPDKGWVEREYRHRDKRGVYHHSDLTGAGLRNGPSGMPWKNIDPAKIGSGRHWRYSPETLDRLDSEGRIYWPTAGKYPKLKVYLEETGGTSVGYIWADIQVIGRTAAERLGYPTQKPEALLERIITASSNEGDVVLDPFCGCGTAVAVAQRLNRRWIGIDITHLAIALIKTRLHDAYGPGITSSYKVIGEPTALPDAEALAKQDRYQFQYWALGLLGARPVAAEQKKGADKGVDGRLYFHDDAESGKVKQVIFSVKSGHLKNEYVRELPGILEREKAQIGVLVTLELPTQPMKTEAASGGFYQSPWGTKHPKVQILTVGDILAGKRVDLPPTPDHRTFKKAPKVKKRPNTKENGLAFGDDDDD